MTSKRLYKVTLTGWVVKEENQDEVLEWPFDTIVDEMIGEQLTVTFVDSNDRTVTPRSDVEKHKQIAEVYVAGEEKLEQIDPAQDGINAVKEDILTEDEALGELVVQSYGQERSAADDSDEDPPLKMELEEDLDANTSDEYEEMSI